MSGSNAKPSFPFLAAFAVLGNVLPLRLGQLAKPGIDFAQVSLDVVRRFKILIQPEVCGHVLGHGFRHERTRVIKNQAPDRAVRLRCEHHSEHRAH